METLDSVVPGAANLLLREAVQQAQGSEVQTVTSVLPLVLGTLGALITGTTLLGQIERALNRDHTGSSGTGPRSRSTGTRRC